MEAGTNGEEVEVARTRHLVECRADLGVDERHSHDALKEASSVSFPPFSRGVARGTNRRRLRSRTARSGFPNEGQRHLQPNEEGGARSCNVSREQQRWSAPRFPLLLLSFPSAVSFSPQNNQVGDKVLAVALDPDAPCLDPALPLVAVEEKSRAELKGDEVAKKGPGRYALFQRVSQRRRKGGEAGWKTDEACEGQGHENAVEGSA